MEMNWNLESCRLTAFLFPDQEPNLISLWKHVSGRVHEKMVDQPGQFRSVHGKIGKNPSEIFWGNDGKLNFQVHPISEETELVGIGFPFEEFRSLSEALGGFSIYRLAIGSVLIESVDSLSAGVLKLKPLLEGAVNVDETSMRDILFRLTQRSEIQGVTVNRIRTWSIAEQIEFSLPNPGVGNKSYFARLETDINNAVEPGSVATIHLESLLEILISETRQVADGGAIA
jgi:hypothetical protein